jgi:predicted ATPase
MSSEALDAARQLNHVNTLAYSLLFACFFEQFRRAEHDAQDRAEALVTLATEQNLPHYIAAATMVRGWALTEAGDMETGLAQLRRGLPAWRASGARLYEPFFLGLQAEAHGRANSPNEGLGLVARALHLVSETGERWFEAELHRLAGELMLLSPTPDRIGAEGRLRQAMAIARRLGSRLWELRAASLTRLWRDQGRCDEARDLLAPIYGGFTEGFGTPDLGEAKALLDDLTE